MVEDPGTLTVTCDDCGDVEIEVFTISYIGNMYGPDYEILISEGWSADDSEQICPSCKKKVDEDAEN